MRTQEELKVILKNQTTGIKMITAELSNYDTFEKFDNEVIESILTYHPRKSISNIQYLIIKKHPQFKTKMLCYKQHNEPEDNVSYKHCIKNIFGRYSNDKNQTNNKKKAFRNATYNIKRATFRDNLESKHCQDCGCMPENEKYHIDHYKVSFKEILERFLEKKNLKLNNVITYYDDSQYHISNRKLKDEFIEYHDSRVIYKLLCPRCNMSNGSYGY